MLFWLSFILLIALIFYLYQILPIAAAYNAKYYCSAVFVAGRDPQTLSDDVFPFHFIKNKIDEKNKTVTSSFYGFFQQTAIYRDGFGSTLIHQDEPDSIKKIPVNFLRAKNDTSKFFEKSNTNNFDSVELEKILDWEFQKNRDGWHKQTRAIIILKNGQLVAERYANGFDKNTRLMGWSMTKSITNALFGILIKQGKINLNDKNLFAEWEKDDRRNITIDQLLRMSTGLKFNENYYYKSDATKMLFLEKGAGDYALNLPLKFQPESHWDYASGTSNILSKIIRNLYKNNNKLYYNFAGEELFDKLGMRSALMETDATGTYVGSSFCWATARDWAKLGQLFLQDGVWEGERILPAGWVDYTRTPTPPSKGEYGAHFWTNTRQTRFPKMPKEAYLMSGFQGQSVTILPEHDMVVVRLGVNIRENKDLDEFVSKVLNLKF